jgi:AcrR family transcriptional regulator
VSHRRVDTILSSTKTCEDQAGFSVAEQIGRTALTLFARKGYTATSVNEIVEAAGVTKPMLYYYFGSKEQLARHLVVEPLEALVRQLEEFADETLDARECELRWLQSQLSFCRADPDRARFVFALYFGPLGAELADAVGQFGQSAKLILTRIVQRRPEIAGFGEVFVDDYVRSIHGQMISTVIEMLYTDPKSTLWSIPVEELSTNLISQLDHGFLNWKHNS